jgi:hypothetical protein
MFCDHRGFQDHTVCSDPFRKFSILPNSSTTSQIRVLTRSDSIGRVLSIELSRFYHGTLPQRQLKGPHGRATGQDFMTLIRKGSASRASLETLDYSGSNSGGGISGRQNAPSPFCNLPFSHVHPPKKNFTWTKVLRDSADGNRTRRSFHGYQLCCQSESKGPQ